MDARPSFAAGRRELTKAQNRETILAAARVVFDQLGSANATVRDIIRATPLASGTFYNYFKSKEEVYQAIRDDVALAIRPKLREERLKADTVEGFISGSFRMFFEFVSRNREDFRHLRHAADASRLRIDTPGTDEPVGLLLRSEAEATAARTTLIGLLRETARGFANPPRRRASSSTPSPSGRGRG